MTTKEPITSRQAGRTAIKRMPKNDCSPAQQVHEGEDGFICDDAHMATYAKYFRRYIDAFHHGS